MATRQHNYECTVTWTGNTGSGTSGYREYERANEIAGPHGKPVIQGSSDPAFRGDRTRWNPEELLVAGLSQCHMLFFLHRASEAGVVVVDYSDSPTGSMLEEESGPGRFTSVTLRPRVTVSEPAMVAMCGELHEQAHIACFLANSVNFPVTHEASVLVAQTR